MWLVKRLSDGRIMSAQVNCPPELPGHEVFEWFGDYEVNVVGHTTPDGVEIPDVFGIDPRPAGWDSHRSKFDDIVTMLDDEIDYLDTTIPDIESMTMPQALAVVKRLAQENRQVLRAFKYFANRLEI